MSGEYEPFELQPIVLEAMRELGMRESPPITFGEVPEGYGGWYRFSREGSPDADGKWQWTDRPRIFVLAAMTLDEYRFILRHELRHHWQMMQAPNDPDEFEAYLASKSRAEWDADADAFAALGSAINPDDVPPCAGVG